MPGRRAQLDNTMQNKRRPVFLNLLQIHLPLGGVLSILHRITGVLLVLAIPVFIYIHQLLNADEDSFTQALELMQTIPGRIILSLIVWMLIQHSLSGIRHLMMDLDFSYDRSIARKTAGITFVSSLLLILLTGVMIWR